jgi:hypothetical protein
VNDGGRANRPGSPKSGAPLQSDDPVYVPPAVDIGAQLRARINRKADQSAPKRDGIERVPQKGDDGHEYKHDIMHPGPLSSGLASGYFGGKYDEHALKAPKVFYRVCSRKEAEGGQGELGRWYTDQPVQSDIQLQIDAAVKPVWRDNEGAIKGQSPPEYCLTVRVPAGAKVYPGPVAGQGDAFLGGMGKTQYCIPDIRKIPGVEITAKVPFKRDGHVQPGGEHKSGGAHPATPAAHGTGGAAGEGHKAKP